MTLALSDPKRIQSLEERLLDISRSQQFTAEALTICVIVDGQLDTRITLTLWREGLSGGIGQRSGAVNIYQSIELKTPGKAVVGLREHGIDGLARQMIQVIEECIKEVKLSFYNKGLIVQSKEETPMLPGRLDWIYKRDPKQK